MMTFLSSIQKYNVGSSDSLKAKTDTLIVHARKPEMFSRFSTLEEKENTLMRKFVFIPFCSGQAQKREYPQ